MVRTNPLRIVRRIYDPDVRIELPHAVDDGRRQLKIDVVEMYDIRRKALQHPPDVSFGFRRIQDLKRVRELCQLRSPMEVHGSRVNLRRIAHDAPLMLHAEILHLVPHGRKLCARLEKICLRSPVGIEEFIHHQDPHRMSSLLFSLPANGCDHPAYAGGEPQKEPQPESCAVTGRRRGS